MATGNQRTSDQVKYELDQTFVTIPGTIVKVLLEFPEYSEGKSAIIELDDVMTISSSVYRIKPSVVLLGQNSVDGYGLGVKTVAGSMIRSVFMTDKLTEFQSKCYLLDQEKIQARLEGLDSQVPSGVPLKDQLSFMKDDLATFNIHMLAVSESTKLDADEYVPHMRSESILGAVIINSGQIFSIEDLITETNVSFQAKAIRATSNIEDYTRGFSTQQAFVSISSLL